MSCVYFFLSDIGGYSILIDILIGVYLRNFVKLKAIMWIADGTIQFSFYL